MASYLHEDEPLPSRTTPQGTQADGVDHGFEERDVDFRALVRWFFGLAVGMAIVMPFVWFGYRVAVPMITGDDRPPSPVFETRWDLPTPRVLPNPFDAPRNLVVPLPQPLMRPWQFREEHQRAEAAALEKLELKYPPTFEDRRRADLPRLPESAVDAVIARAAAPPAAGGATTDGVRQMIPSGASGGTRMEDRLR
jgi:hypothetical protein